MSSGSLVCGGRAIFLYYMNLFQIQRMFIFNVQFTASRHDRCQPANTIKLINLTNHYFSQLPSLPCPGSPHPAGLLAAPYTTSPLAHASSHNPKNILEICPNTRTTSGRTATFMIPYILNATSNGKFVL